MHYATHVRPLGTTAAILIALCGVARTALGEGGIAADRLKGVQAPESSKVLGLARRELIGGLEMLYGVKVPAVSEAPDGPAVLLGRQAALAAGIVSDADLEKVSPGGYLIRSHGDKLAVAGVHEPATVYGVRALLEKLGLRYFRWTRPTVVSRPKDKMLPPMDLASKPALVYRNYYSRPLEWADCSRVEPVQREGLWIDHSAGYLIPKDLYYDEHPEYFAMRKDGTRAPKDSFTYHRTPLCISHPDVRRISAERLLKWIEKQPEKVFFPVTYGDTGLWCSCPDCRKLDEKPGEYAARLLNWVNAVAAPVAWEHPDKILVTAAYGGSDLAPESIRPAENVWMLASVNLAGLRLWDHDVARGKARKALDKLNPWLEIAPGRVTVCEYQSGRYYPAVVDTLAGKYRFYKKIGVKGLLFSYGYPSSFKGLWDYLYPRLMWDPEQDAHALAAEYVRHHFGPAADAMAEYFALCHARYEQTRRDLDTLGDDYYAAFYGEGFADKALDCFARAYEAAGRNDALREEIAHEAVSLIADWMANPLSKKLTSEAEDTLRNQLNSLLRFTPETDEARIDLAQRVHRVALTAESERKGTLAVVETWLEDQDFPRPQVVEKLPGGGVRIPAAGFVYAGWGPATYKGGHALPPCPPRTAVCIYVDGNDRNRSPRTEAEFELDAMPGDGAAKLDFLGQDCDHKVEPAEIRILVNDRKVYEGQVAAVKGNWSRQVVDIPAGVLKKGTNKIEFVNVSDLKSIENWYERWFMLSQATIRFR